MITMMKDSSDRMVPFDRLCDNTFAQMMLFLDFESAVRFSRTTCSSLTHRCSQVSQNSALDHFWRQVFSRHHFARDAAPFVKESSHSSITSRHDTVEECRLRRSLFGTLVDRRKSTRNVFNLPNRHFYFVPVAPDDKDNDEMQWDDAPPVDFDCVSFLLTSSGQLGELVFLDPFTRSLRVHENCVHNAVASDEAMMLHAMLDAANVIRRRASLGLHDVPDEDIAGAIFDESVYRNHNMEEYRVDASQVLLSEEEYFEVDVSKYFSFTNQRNSRRREGNMVILHEEDEVEVGYLGIDRKFVLGDTNEISATMIAAARDFWSDPENGSEALGCTEVLTWTRRANEKRFERRQVCRFNYEFRTLEVCAKYSRLYVSFLSRRRSTSSSDTVLVYPLVPCDAHDNNKQTPSAKYCPNSLFSIKCDGPVALVTVDGTGNSILIGTTQGTVELWKTNGDSSSQAHRVGILHLKESAIKSAKRARSELTSSSQLYTLGSEVEVSGESPPAMTPIESDADDTDQIMESDTPNDLEGTDDWHPNFFSSDRVQAILYPLHLPFETCGFVTLQHTRGEGTTLLLWRKASSESASRFEVASQINLPLSSQRKPLVHFDGRRIIVFGQDHIGMILLVYHVLSSWEDMRYFETNDGRHTKCTGDESGGLYNFTSPHRVRFANRVRHAGLGGMLYYDSIHMTCNERFVVVNTKTGNLMGGGSSLTGEGLLVIDLLDHASR